MLISNFSLVSGWVLSAEGGYVAALDDRGGTTKYGISLAFLRLLPDGDRDHDGDIDADDIRWLTEADALAIYEHEFWAGGRCGELPPHVAISLFDARVNHQPATAARLVQRALGVNADGIIGAVTIRAALATGASASDFLARYFSLRAQLYADLVRSNSTQAKFELGWYARLFRLQEHISRCMRQS